MLGLILASRFGPAVRRVVAAFVVIVVVAVTATTLLVVRHTSDVKTVPTALSLEQATLKMVPSPGATGTATCTDPIGKQEWRVTWRSIDATGSATQPGAADPKPGSAPPAVAPPTAASSTSAPPAVTPPRTSHPSRSAPSSSAPSHPGSPDRTVRDGKLYDQTLRHPARSGGPGAGGSAADGSGTDGSGQALADSDSTVSDRAVFSPALARRGSSLHGPSSSSPAAPAPSSPAPSVPGPSGSAPSAPDPSHSGAPSSAPSSSGQPSPGPSSSAPSVSSAPVPPPASSTSPPAPSPNLSAEVTKKLIARTSAVTLVPTGFAVRPLQGTSPAADRAATTSGGATTPEAAVTTPDSTLPDGWQSRDLDRWLLRWTPTPRQVRTAAANEEWVRMGPLSTLAAIRMSARQDPRFVTPDGACTVYLVPFLSGQAGRNNTVAVVGDSLVGQVSAPKDSHGALVNRLAAKGERAEISGQGGRRFSVKPDGLTSFEQADSTMLDELRGLRAARSLVVALGTNDAGWVAHAPSREQYELRLSWVMTQIEHIVDELAEHGHCTVLVTMAQRDKNYSSSRAGTFDLAAGRINDYLRRRAEADPDDRLRLYDWGTHADAHGTADPQPWFGKDTIHLKKSGRSHYADELTAAAALC